MAELQIWFLDVGHGDCAYIQLPNDARMMIDCGGGDNHWPSLLLKHYKITKNENPVPIPNKPYVKYGLDNLVITHPHGDHLSDIQAIHDDIGFFLLTGGYGNFIDDIDVGLIDFRKRGKEAAEKFKEIVKIYCGQYVESEDRVASAKSLCVVKKQRFIGYSKDMDLNELSWFVSFEMAGQKILFAADITSACIGKILKSNMADVFKDFVRGTTVLKIPHHGRENGCSQELFDCFGSAPALAVASDESLNDRNENTSSTSWYSSRISDIKVLIDGTMQDRKVLTTRMDKDIFLSVSELGVIKIQANCFKDVKAEILESTTEKSFF